MGNGFHVQWWLGDFIQIIDKLRESQKVVCMLQANVNFRESLNKLNVKNKIIYLTKYPCIIAASYLPKSKHTLDEPKKSDHLKGGVINHIDN